MGDDLAELDAMGQARLVRTNGASPADLVDAAIARIERLDPKVHAVVSPTFDKARAMARAAALADGPFRGVPMLLEDFLCATAGDPYYEGMQFLRHAGWREPHDSSLATRFRSAGLVVLGRTNTPELAGMPITEPATFGPTHNPWDVRRSTGGSSGGSAAAVASGMVPVAHGNDGIGSLRIPAAACGLVALNPSQGLVFTGADGHTGILGNIREFVLTRTVRDAAAMLSVLAARPIRLPPAEGEQVRIGILTRDLWGGAAVHPECVAAVERTAHALEALGHPVEDAHPRWLEHQPDVERELGVIDSCSVAARLAYWSHRTGRLVTGLEVEPYTWARAEHGRSLAAIELYLAVQHVRTQVAHLLEWWAAGWDLLVSPTLAQPPPVLGELLPDPADPLAVIPRQTAAIGRFTTPFSYTGQPAISLPLHWTPDGLPVGVQLVAAAGRDALLLHVAAELERALPWSARRPPVHA
jgi:amidase